MNRYIAMKPKMRIVEAQNSCVQQGSTYTVQCRQCKERQNKLLPMTLQQTCTCMTLTV